MAKGTKEKVEVLKKISLKDLAEKYKKRIPIKYNGEILFTMEELTNKDFDSFIKNIVTAKSDEVEVDNDSQAMMLGFNEERIGWLIRHMIKSDVVDIDALNDKETLEAINSFGVEIMSQITEAMKELALKPIQDYFTKISKQYDELLSQIKKEGNETNEETETENATTQES